MQHRIMTFTNSSFHQQLVAGQQVQQQQEKLRAG
jgi:hypothetical protein